MRSAMKSTVLCAMLSITTATVVLAQDKVKDEKEIAYAKVVTERADKIITTLGLTDVSKATKVRDIIAQQYIDLN